MPRGTEDQLGHLHGLVTDELLAALEEEAPEQPDSDDHDAMRWWREAMHGWRRRRAEARQDAMRLLKDNGISAAKGASPALERVAAKLPDREALERLMRSTPD